METEFAHTNSLVWFILKKSADWALCPPLHINVCRGATSFSQDKGWSSSSPACFPDPGPATSISRDLLTHH